MEWFSDIEHLQRFGGWLDAPAGQSVRQHLQGALECDVSPVVIADELVLRGAEWLEQRWQQGGFKLKHMAVALRAAHLTPAQFADRWKSRAGQIRRPGEAVVVIPDEARGRAYVQNHPRPGGDWAYDAINEVYFDDVESLRRRVDWFTQNLGDDAEEDLIRESHFIAVREEVLGRS